MITYTSKKKKTETVISKVMKLIYAVIMFFAAVIIWILYEGIKSLNIYFVYILLGLIIGMGIVLILKIFTKD